MASLQNFYTSRDNNANADSYVGQLDRLWYNPNLNSIYVSDGNTPGGIPVGLATAANAIFTNITVEGSVLGDLNITGNISAAANNKIGGIAPGPGINISNIGILTIDSANLPVSFGNFYANNNILSIVNANEDMILSSQGNAEIQLIGNIGFYKPDGLPPDVANRYAFFNNDGQVTFYVPTVDPFESAVQVIGSTSGNTIPPGQPGAMLHITGQYDLPSRVYFDGNNDYVALVARRWNGNVAAPTQVLAGDDVLRINATAASNVGVGNVAFGQIRFTALEDQTTAAQGSSITFTVTPVGSAASARVDVANVTVANGISATKFTTTGNITAGNVVSFIQLPAGTASQSPLLFAAGNIQIIPPTQGSMSYDGRVFYATPQDAERGLIVTEQVFIPNTNYTLTNQTAVQSMFGKSVSLSSSTRYAYRLLAVVYKVSNNIALQYATDGNVVLASHSYQTTSTASATLATISTPGIVRNILTTGFDTAVTVSAALNGTGYYSLTINGILDVTTGGTWNPLIGFTGLPGTGSYTAASSSIEVWPIGPSGANVSIGNWT